MSARRILRVGLTGGIACGKTTVAAMLAGLGARVVDADVVAHELMARGGAAHAAVVARFGPGILDPAGNVERPRLARIVFADPAARRDLEAIVHPLVRDAARRRIAEPARHDAPPIAVLDAALLLEAGAAGDVDRVIVVRCSPATQLARLAARGMTTAEAAARIAAQAPQAAKLAVADHVIDTDGTLEQTRRDVEAVWEMLRAEAARQAAP